MSGNCGVVIMPSCGRQGNLFRTYQQSANLDVVTSIGTSPVFVLKAISAKNARIAMPSTALKKTKK